MKNNNKKILKKLAILVIGSIIAAYGITLALYAGFGGATLAVLWQGIARTFHISIGTASFVVALGMILFALIYDKSQIHIGTVLYQIVYSTCVDLFANCHIYSTYKWINFLIMVFCLAESLVYARLLQLSFQAQLSNLLMRKQNKF